MCQELTEVLICIFSYVIMLKSFYIFAHSYGTYMWHMCVFLSLLCICTSVIFTDSFLLVLGMYICVCVCVVHGSCACIYSCVWMSEIKIKSYSTGTVETGTFTGTFNLRIRLGWVAKGSHMYSVSAAPALRC